MNEIIIYADGTRTITGEAAHTLAFSPHWQEISCTPLPGRFYVYEGPILRAAQSSIKGAYSYMSPDRVMVYRNTPHPAP